MNITFFIGSLKGGGAERVVCNLANFLAEKGHDITVLTIHEPEDRSHLNENVRYSNLVKTRISFGFLRTLVKMFSLWYYVLTNKTDVYIPFLPKSCESLLYFKKIIKCPIIITERSAPENLSHSEQEKLIKCARKADGAVWQTSGVSDWYQAYVSFPTCIIPNAINQDFLVEKYNGVRTKRIVAVGRLIKLKGFDLLIDAFSILSQRFNDYHLYIYGEGSYKEVLVNKINTLCLSEKVRLLGFVDNIQDAIKDASVFVSSSDYEGMPNALMEAMALGLPCVATDCSSGGPRFLIKDRINGLLVPVRDTHAMANAITTILENNVFATTIGEEAFKIRDMLSAECIYSQWEKYIIEVINRKRN